MSVFTNPSITLCRSPPSRAKCDQAVPRTRPKRDAASIFCKMNSSLRRANEISIAPILPEGSEAPATALPRYSAGQLTQAGLWSDSWFLFRCGPGEHFRPPPLSCRLGPGSSTGLRPALVAKGPYRAATLACLGLQGPGNKFAASCRGVNISPMPDKALLALIAA